MKKSNDSGFENIFKKMPGNSQGSTPTNGEHEHDTNLDTGFSPDGEGGNGSGSKGDVHEESLFRHYIKGCASGFFVGVTLLVISLLPKKYGGGLGQQLSDGFFLHYGELPSVLIVSAILILSISVFIEKGIAEFIRNWIAKPIFEFLHHALSISAGMLPCLLIVEIAKKESSWQLWGMFLYLEIALFFVGFLLMMLIFVIENGEHEYAKISEKYNTTADFRKAIKILLFVTAVIFIVNCIFDLQRIVDISNKKSHDASENCSPSH